MKAARILAVSALLLFLLAGCSETHVTRPIADPVPSPSTPQGAVRLLQWCWNDMDTTRYREVFTDDFQFVFSLADSAGNQFWDDPFGREEMLLSARHLFAGGGSASSAASIVFTLDDNLFALDDSRPGKDSRWHKLVPTGLNLGIETLDLLDLHVTGAVTFFVVRGDSAAIPADLGFAPDSARWYVERIEDGTLGSSLSAAVRSPQPSANATWGRILALYLQ